MSKDFEDYNHGDLITIVSEYWDLWPKGKDSPVTHEKAASDNNSLKLEGKKQATGN